jgi:hypothetical protein
MQAIQLGKAGRIPVLLEACTNLHGSTKQTIRAEHHGGCCIIRQCLSGSLSTSLVYNGAASCYAGPAGRPAAAGHQLKPLPQGRACPPHRGRFLHSDLARLLCDTAQLGHRRAAGIVRGLRVPMSCPVALARSTAAGPGADLCTKTDNSYCVPDELEAAWDSPGHQQPAGCGARSPAGRRTSHAPS